MKHALLVFALNIGFHSPFLEAFCFSTISDEYLPASYSEEIIIKTLLFMLDLHLGGDAKGKMSKGLICDFSFLAQQIQRSSILNFLHRHLSHHMGRD